jgi:hypothetical protein
MLQKNTPLRGYFFVHILFFSFLQAEMQNTLITQSFLRKFVFFVDSVRMRTLLKRDKRFHAQRKP